jgi:cytoskeletal protein RodZ
MIKKIVSRAVIILAGAAAFTFVAAQFSWEDDYGSGSSSSSSSSSYDSPASSDSPPYYESSDEFGTSSYRTSETAAETDAEEVKKDAKPEKPAREPKAQKSKKTSRRTTEPSFASAFEGPQKTCPVCVSKRLKSRMYVESSGKKIHVCSAACIGRVKRNPQAFAAKLEKRGEQLAGM